MNQEHPNIVIVKKFNPTNISAATEVLTEDAVWHYFNPMLPNMQGDYVGLKGFQAFFEKMSGHTGGTFKVNPISIIPVGDELVVVHVKDTMVFEDQQMELDAVVVWRIVGGKIIEAWDIPGVYTAKVL